jgi:hypothetical protein
VGIAKNGHSVENFFVSEESRDFFSAMQSCGLKFRHIGPCHVSGIPLQKGFFPFCKGEKPRCLAGE